MSDRKITLLELHVDGETQFGPKSIGGLPFGSDADDADADPDADADEAEAESGSKGKAIGVLIGLVVLAGIAVAAKKFRGGDDELEEFEEPDVVVN